MPRRPATIFSQRGRGDLCTSLDRRFDVAMFPPPRFCARSSQIGSLGASAQAVAARFGCKSLESRRHVPRCPGRRDTHSRGRHCGRVQPFPPCNGDTFQYRVRGTAVALPHSDRRAWRGHPGYQRAMLAPGGGSHLLLSKVRPAIYCGIAAGFALSGTYGGCHGSASRR